MELRPYAHALFVLLAAPAVADEVVLRHGGRVEGTLARDAEVDRSQLAIDSPWGRLVLDRALVARTTPTPPALAEYTRRAPTVSDTADAQFALAQWCRNNGLAEQLRTHLTRVLELDPDHAEARQLLGYQQVSGEWVTRDDVLAARGLVRHDGAFRTRQEVELLQRKAEAERVAREWKERLRRLRDDLDARDPDTSRAAVDALAALDDPAASGALAALMVDEANPEVLALLIDAAGRLATPATLQALARVALEHPDPDTRRAACERLHASGVRGLAAPFVTALGSSDNARVNRAAEALTALGEEHALRPLVDALVTAHRTQVGADSGGETYSFTPTTGQFSFGGGGPKVVKQEVRNPSVHRALVDLTGVNFEYDEPRWREWLAARDAAAPIDLRRDE